MAFLVAQQARAIGLRMALGASPGRVLRVVLQDAVRRVLIGAAIGLAVAWAISQAFHSFVFGIRPTEPAIYLVVAAGLTLVGLSAAIVPALRASRVDPLVTLRSN
jgi:ABC-type antimicrobial peptide transport system permease subunit